MPQVAGFALGALGIGAGTSFLGGAAMFGAWTAGAAFAGTALGAIAIRLTASVALSALARAIAPKPKISVPGLRTDQTLTGGVNPEAIILGRFATAGALAAPLMSHGTADKTPNAYLTYVVELAGRPGHQLDGLLINGEPVEILPDSPHADYGQRIGGRFEGRAWVKYYDGTQTAADPMLLAKYPAPHVRPWSADMVGHGICYAILTFRYDREVYTQFPSVKLVLTGLPLYDPRLDSTAGGAGPMRWDDPGTWAPTRNLAVIIYNILRGIDLGGDTWGGGIPAEDLPYAVWAAAMDACDAQLSDGAGGTEAAFEGGMEVLADDEPFGVIEELLKGCNGMLAESGGVWSIRIGGPGLPVLAISDDDIMADAADDYRPFPPLSEIYNAIEATWTDPGSAWAARDAAPRYNPDWEAEDGGRRLTTSVPLPVVLRGTQADRVMAALIADHRRMRVHQITLPPRAERIRPLETITWTSDSNGYLAKLFEVVRVDRELLTGRVRVTLREMDAGDFAPPVVVRPLPPDLTPQLPAVQTVPGWGVAPWTIEDSTSTPRRPAVRATWLADAAEDARGIRIAVRLVGETGAGVEMPIQDLRAGAYVYEAALPGEQYEMRGRLVVDRATVWSAWEAAQAPDVRLSMAELDAAAQQRVEDLEEWMDTYPEEVDTALQGLQVDYQAAEDAAALAAGAKDAAEVAAGEAVTARTAAETARSGAETARAEAVSAKDDAAGSASTAATQATTATTAATSAGNSATAAAGSATVASTKATEAEQSASAAAASATTAATKAGAASTSASNAATSATSAAGSASAASTSASTAASSKDAAAGSASAAATSASQAATSATNAGTAAASATTARNDAQTAASSASASSGTAVSARNDAQAAASAAATALTQVTAQRVLDELVLDPTFAAGFTHWPVGPMDGSSARFVARNLSLTSFVYNAMPAPRAMRITPDDMAATPTQWRGLSYQSVRAGEEIVVSFSYARAVNGVQPRGYIRFRDKDGAVFGTQFVTGDGSGSWLTAILRVVVPAGAVEAQVYLIGNGAGWVNNCWVTNVSAKRGQEAYASGVIKAEAQVTSGGAEVTVGLGAKAGFSNAGVYLRAVSEEPSNVLIKADGFYLFDGTTETMPFAYEAGELYLNARVTAQYLEIDQLLSFTDTGALTAFKSSPDDTTDGLFFGKVEEMFAFSASRTGAGGSTQEVRLASDGFRLTNAEFWKRSSGVNSEIRVTATTGLISLAGKTMIRIPSAIGGGGGGVTGSGADGTAGTATVIKLWDGSTLMETITAAGGVPGSGTAPNGAGERGLDPGNRGGGGSGAQYIDGGGRRRQGRGGEAGKIRSMGWVNISAWADPKIEITIGAAGAGGAVSAVAGAAIYQTAALADVQTDTVPLKPTFAGSFTKVSGAAGSFPNLGTGYGAGIWLLYANSEINFANLDPGDGNPMTPLVGRYLMIISSKTPIYGASSGNPTIAYRYFAMGET